MDPMLADFRAALAGISLTEPRIGIVSNVTGGLADAGLLTDPEYWVRHVRGTVRFADGVDALREQGVHTLLEVGPDAVLTPMVAEQGAIPLLRRERPEAHSLVTAVGHLHARGATVDWSAVFAGIDAHHVDLRACRTAGAGPGRHPVLGRGRPGGPDRAGADARRRRRLAQRGVARTEPVAPAASAQRHSGRTALPGFLAGAVRGRARCAHRTLAAGHPRRRAGRDHHHHLPSGPG